jgi:hypothetical protein
MKDLVNKHVPLIRPVLAASKKGYLTDAEMNTPAELEFNTSHIKLVNFTKDITDMSNGPVSDVVMNYYNTFRNYLDTYSTLIFDKDRPRFTAKADQEFFRESVGDKINTIGFVAAGKKDDLKPYIKEIDVALDRMLATTYRPDLDGPNKVFMPAEESTLKETLLFPLEVAASMGANKTGSLFEDVMRSMTKQESVKEILDKYKDSDDITKSVYTIEERPVGFDDYLRKQPIVGFGPGDFQEALVDYGLRDSEINMKQMSVFEEKMRSSVSQLIEYLKDMREQMKEIVSAAPVKIFDTDIDKEIPENEPILEKILAEFKTFVNTNFR